MVKFFKLSGDSTDYTFLFGDIEHEQVGGIKDADIVFLNFQENISPLFYRQPAREGYEFAAPSKHISQSTLVRVALQSKKKLVAFGGVAQLLTAFKGGSILQLKEDIESNRTGVDTLYEGKFTLPESGNAVLYPYDMGKDKFKIRMHSLIPMEEIDVPAKGTFKAPEVIDFGDSLAINTDLLYSYMTYPEYTSCMKEHVIAFLNV